MPCAVFQTASFNLTASAILRTATVAANTAAVTGNVMPNGVSPSNKDTVGHESARNAGCGETAAVIADISDPAI